MELEILSVKKHGTLRNERIVIKVLEDCNLRDYLLLDSTFDEHGGLSDLWPHSYRFPSLEVAVDELVVLYTKQGEYERIVTELGTVNHRLFWGLSDSVWNQDGDFAALIQIAVQDAKAV